jgi:hypothetical protein
MKQFLLGALTAVAVFSLGAILFMRRFSYAHGGTRLSEAARAGGSEPSSTNRGKSN